MFINSKDELINYFHKGAKKDLFIGVENEKFLFEQSTNSRAAYSKVKEVLKYLKKSSVTVLKLTNCFSFSFGK